jgi:hypothetical protein
MSSNSLRVVVGATLALAVSGIAMANTNLDGTSTGDIFLNIVDTQNQNSYLFDTGISQASFTGTTSLTPINLTANANYNTFISGAAGHTLTYSVVSGTFDGVQSAKAVYTSQLGQNAVAGSAIANSLTSLINFASNANGVSTASTNDVVVPTATPYWGDPTIEGIFSTNLTANANGDNAAIGTAMAFFKQATTNIGSDTLLATLSTFAGTWDLTAAGILSYTVAGAVPLPAPLLLLLSGLGLTGLLGRRKNLTIESGAAAA